MQFSARYDEDEEFATFSTLSLTSCSSAAYAYAYFMPLSLALAGISATALNAEKATSASAAGVVCPRSCMSPTLSSGSI